jgi:hypothetical protein
MYSEHKRLGPNPSTRFEAAEPAKIRPNGCKSGAAAVVQQGWTLGGPFGHS